MKDQIEQLLAKVEHLQGELQEIQTILYELKEESTNKARMEQSQLGYDNKIEVSEQVSDVILEDTIEDKEEQTIRPQVLQFFELRTMKERANYLRYTMNWKEITDNEISLISSSMDIVLQEGNMECKIRDLISYVEKLAQWEIKGTRG